MNITYANSAETSNYYTHLEELGLLEILLGAIGSTIASAGNRRQVIPGAIQVTGIKKGTGLGEGLEIARFEAEILTPPILVRGSAILDKRNAIANPGGITCWAKIEV